MSGMFEPKQDKAKRKQARTVQEENEKKKTKRTAIIITVVFVVVLTISLLLNSNIFHRTLPVLTIDGVGFTTAEFEFFYNMSLRENMHFLTQFQGIEGMGGTEPDFDRPLSGQIRNEETGETWADFITGETLNRLSRLVPLYNAAREAGFALPDEQIEIIESAIENAVLEAQMFQITTANVLQRSFGSSMNVNVFRRVLEFELLADAYSDFVRDSFSYSVLELEEYYAENADSLDVINYRILTVFAEFPDETDSASDTSDEDAIAAAHAVASEMAAGIESEGDFISAAYEFDMWSHGNPDSTLRTVMGEWLDFDLSPWLTDETRMYGDVTIIDTSMGSNIVFFVSRDDNSSQTVGMRQILIMREFVDPEEFSFPEDEQEYELALEAAEREADERAQSVHELFISMGATEQALLDMLEEHSDEDTEGGYYSHIAKFSYHGSTFSSMKVVPEIEEWLFDESREVGDSELVFTSDFGYHLLYFTGRYEPLSELMATDRKRTADHAQWLDSLTSGEPVWHAAFWFVNI